MQCTKCKKDKEPTDFYKGYKNCKACELAYQRAWRKKKRAKAHKKAKPATFVQPKVAPRASAKYFLVNDRGVTELQAGARSGDWIILTAITS